MTTANRNTGGPGKREAPTAPGRFPLLGHTAALLRQRLAFAAGLRSRGPVVRAYLGRLPLCFVATAELAHRAPVDEAFEKGIPADELRRASGDGPVSADGDFHRRQRRVIRSASHRRVLVRYSETTTAAAEELANSWRCGLGVRPDRSLQDLATSVHEEEAPYSAAPPRTFVRPGHGHSIDVAPNARDHCSAVAAWAQEEVGR